MALPARHTLPENRAKWCSRSGVARHTTSAQASFTTSRPVVAYVYASQAPDLRALLSELGIQLTENGENVWIMIPGT